MVHDVPQERQSHDKYTTDLPQGGNLPLYGEAPPSPAPHDAEAAPSPDLITSILLDHDDTTFSENLLQYIANDDDAGPRRKVLYEARVLARLCALDDVLFLRTLLKLAEPEHTDLEILYHEPIMIRLASLPYAKYHGVFLRGIKHFPGCDVLDYRRELRPYLLRHSAQQGCRHTFAPMTGAALYAKDIAELEFIAEDILPVGATLFVGRAKDGKSLAMWNLLFAVTTGGVVFGKYPTTKGPALYLALEDGERRAKKRLMDQMRAFKMETPPEDLYIQCWEAPRVGHGLEEELHRWIDEHPGAKLIVIDILEKVRPPRTRNGSVYQDDYAAVAPCNGSPRTEALPSSLCTIRTKPRPTTSALRPAALSRCSEAWIRSGACAVSQERRTPCCRSPAVR